MSKKIVIIGGGVVGLNIALEFAESKKFGDIFLIEREKFLGHHTSTRNSEVIHAGFAYAPNSLKAKLCVEGNRLTYELLKRLGVSYRRQGKWIVAYTPEEVAALGVLMKNAADCAVPGMRRVKSQDVKDAENNVALPKAAAFSESSGVMDAAGYIRALEVALSKCGANVIYPCEAKEIDMGKNTIITDRGEIEYDVLINSAGLFSDDVYKMAGGKRNFEIRPCKGEYYTWRKGTIQGLIYPVAHRFLNMGDAAKVSSMGVHLHRSVAGDLFIGPTEEMLPVSAKTDYTINISAEEISKRVSPLLDNPPPPSELERGFAGNRPKLFENGKPIGDFVILKDDNIIHLLGIESPGLTAAPAIAKHVLDAVIPAQVSARGGSASG